MESGISEKPSVLVVTVLYRQRLEETNVYRTLLGDAAHVYIHDNSPQPECPRQLPAGWTYASDPSNPGLSAAYNAAAAHARELGLDWLLIADQDTAFPEGMLRSMAEAIAAHPGEPMFLPVVRISNGKYLSPVKMHGYASRLASRPLEGMVSLDGTAAINSGLMVRTDAFIACGGYNEKVPLDFSDFQFIERFARLHPRARVVNVLLRQSFSDDDDDAPTKLRRFGRFCTSLAGFETSRRFGRQMLSAVALKRAMSLTLTTRSAEPFRILWRHYLRRPPAAESAK